MKATAEAIEAFFLKREHEAELRRALEELFEIYRQREEQLLIEEDVPDWLSFTKTDR